MAAEIRQALKRWDFHRRALIISLVAGTILNCINQIPDLMAGESLSIGKLVLTYLVPYTVSMYSSVMALRRG
ncbi:MAG: hypothetical protein KTR32_26470 [Granulosicoccus sp.]|nr:hypothetical protein [Granulosicoccus sp.]